jgi:oligoendopeptidase F
LAKARDVMTLAHELGPRRASGSGGAHSRAIAGLSDTPLTLAETASVFGEMLTFRIPAGRARPTRAPPHLLAGKVEDMLNTVVRQIAFYDFETKCCMRERRTGELTAGRINARSVDERAARKPGQRPSS